MGKLNWLNTPKKVCNFESGIHTLLPTGLDQVSPQHFGETVLSCL
jgi:hypothetical protein